MQGFKEEDNGNIGDDVPHLWNRLTVASLRFREGSSHDIIHGVILKISIDIMMHP